MGMKYTVALRKNDEGFSVRCFELPGCWSQGKDEAKAMANIAEAIEAWLSARSELDSDITYGATLREVVIAG